MNAMSQFARWMLLPALGVGGLMAAGPEQTLRAEVRDEAGIFKPETIERADQEIKAIKQQFHVDLLIETFKEIPADKKAASAANKDGFFDEWARDEARKAAVNGILVLICMDPPYIQYEIARETRQRGAFTPKEGGELRRDLGAKLKAKQ